jgi:hypothetical protein
VFGCCCIQILLEEVGNGAQELYILNRYEWVGHQWQLGRELMQKQANPGNHTTCFHTILAI